MSSTKQCNCCDLFRDDYEVNTMPSGQPGVLFIICEDCEDSCPLDQGGSHICNISGKAMKPDVKQALINNGGAGNGPASQGHLSAGGWGPGGGPQPQPFTTLPQQVQQMMNQMGMGQGPAPKQIPEIPEDAQCDNHGGHWGDDETCEKCTDEDGSPKAYRKPKVRKHLTNTQSAPIDSTLDRLKLQLKAGLDEEGRPLKDADRKAIERQIEIRTAPIDEDEEVRLLLGYDDLDAEARRLFGME